MLNLAVVLEDSARKYPEKDAVIFMDKHITYSQLDKISNQVANGLKSLGIEKGDKVALSCLNLPFFPMVYYGILKVGATVVPLSVLLKNDEIEYHLKDSEAKAYFCFTGTPELPMAKEGYEGFQETEVCSHFIEITGKAEQPCAIEGATNFWGLLQNSSPEFISESTGADDSAVIIYTSGTTGKPKGAELTHSNMMMNAVLSADITNCSSEDKQLIVLPLFHIFGMTVLLNAGVYRGTTNVLLPRFDAATVMNLMQAHEITIFAGVPTMYWALLNHEDESVDIKKISSHLRTSVSGGASLPLQVLEDFEKKFDVPILEGYGMSEGSPVVTFNHKNIGRKPGSIGTPVWGVSVKLVDGNGDEVPVGEKGELIYKGHNVMKGYYKRPEANSKTIKNGWLYSGDIAIKDEDGFYYIVDRTKDMIIRGGLNVYPREVEELMMKHPAVSMVAVIGVPHDRNGEEIKAFVVTREGESVDKETLTEWTKEQIAAYKYPRIIEFVDALPMSATGKILKKELRKN